MTIPVHHHLMRHFHQLNPDGQKTVQNALVWLTQQRPHAHANTRNIQPHKVNALDLLQKISGITHTQRFIQEVLQDTPEHGPEEQRGWLSHTQNASNTQLWERIIEDYTRLFGHRETEKDLLHLNWKKDLQKLRERHQDVLQHLNELHPRVQLTLKTHLEHLHHQQHPLEDQIRNVQNWPLWDTEMVELNLVERYSQTFQVTLQDSYLAFRMVLIPHIQRSNMNLTDLLLVFDARTAQQVQDVTRAAPFLLHDARNPPLKAR